MVAALMAFPCPLHNKKTMRYRLVGGGTVLTFPSDDGLWVDVLDLRDLGIPVAHLQNGTYSKMDDVLADLFFSVDNLVRLHEIVQILKAEKADFWQATVAHQNEQEARITADHSDEEALEAALLHLQEVLGEEATLSDGDGDESPGPSGMDEDATSRSSSGESDGSSVNPFEFLMDNANDQRTALAAYWGLLPGVLLTLILSQDS
jgi:hypothetical protein